MRTTTSVIYLWSVQVCQVTLTGILVIPYRRKLGSSKQYGFTAEKSPPPHIFFQPPSPAPNILLFPGLTSAKYSVGWLRLSRLITPTDNQGPNPPLPLDCPGFILYHTFTCSSPGSVANQVTWFLPGHLSISHNRWGSGVAVGGGGGLTYGYCSSRRRGGGG